jgi:hypothetical protein
MRRLCCLLLAAAGLAALSGCGGPSMAPVKGRVMFKEPGKPAVGFTDENGYYELSTFKPLDGAIVGGHRVSVMIDDTNPARCKRYKELTFEVKPGANECNVDMDAR